MFRLRNIFDPLKMDFEFFLLLRLVQSIFIDRSTGLDQYLH